MRFFHTIFTRNFKDCLFYASFNIMLNCPIPVISSFFMLLYLCLFASRSLDFTRFPKGHYTRAFFISQGHFVKNFHTNFTRKKHPTETRWSAFLLLFTFVDVIIHNSLVTLFTVNVCLINIFVRFRNRSTELFVFSNSVCKILDIVNVVLQVAFL